MDSDYEAIAKAYTNDAKIFVPNRAIIEGREGIKAYWTPSGAHKTSNHEVFPKEITVTGDIAYDYGRYEGTTLRADGEEATGKVSMSSYGRKTVKDGRSILTSGTGRNEA